MGIDIKRIEDLKDIRALGGVLSRLEADRLRPALTDLSLMGDIHAEFARLSEESGMNRYVVRKQFMFIAVWLYSPASLAGEKLPAGLRDAIAASLGLRSPGIVSNELPGLLFYYETYPAFRGEVDGKFSAIAEMLGLDG